MPDIKTIEGANVDVSCAWNDSQEGTVILTAPDGYEFTRVDAVVASEHFAEHRVSNLGKTATLWYAIRGQKNIFDQQHAWFKAHLVGHAEKRS